MRPLPRVLAFADDRIAALDNLGVRAAAIAAAGPAVGLVARLPKGTTDQLATLAQRFVALAAPPMASVFVPGRVDVALAVGAQGVILRANDLTVAGIRAILAASRPAPPPAPFVLCSVHTESEAESAARDGADAIIVGSIWESATHPGRSAGGIALLERAVSVGLPVFAIGGVNAARTIEAREAGAWGVAAIGAIWDAKDSYRAAMELVVNAAG